MNPNNQKDLARLRAAIKYSRQQLRRFRENRIVAIKQFVGTHYSEDGAGDRVPMPFLALAIKIYLRHLAPRRPQALVTSEHRDLLPTAKSLQIALNQIVYQIQLGRTMEFTVLDAMFSMGIVKMGMGPDGGGEQIEGEWHNRGGIFVEPVDLDDIVWDVAARRWGNMAYVGDRYRLPLEEVKASKFFKNTDKLTSTPRAASDQDGDERAETISRGDNPDPDEYEPHVELYDIYLPGERLMVTIPVNGADDEAALRVADWTGPERGPFRLLGFGDVPGQINPLPPIAMWMDLHELANTLYRKLGRQAERQKNNIGYAGGSEGDATRLKEARDGEMIQMDNPQNVREFSTGEVNQTNLAFFIHCRDLFSWVAGNLDSLGGLSPQTETVGQEQLLAASSSKTVEDLQDRTTEFSTETLRDLAWLVWHDPLLEVPIVKPVAGTGISVETRFGPEDREGHWLDYNIRIDPYSLQYLTPQKRLAMLQQTWQMDIMPLLPVLQALGAQPDLEEYIRLKAEYANMPELARLVRFGGTVQEEGPAGSGMPHQATQAPFTRRVNERVNRSAGSRSGTDKVLMQTLLGGRSQESERAAAAGGGS